MENYFSVIISAYNSQDFIFKTLDSIRMQVYTKYEVVVIDDGSTTPVKEMMNDYKNRYPDFPLRYIRQENQGPAAARKRGAEEAQYKYIAMLDHDDIWYPNKLSTMNEAINAHDADVYYHDEMEVATDGKKREIIYRELEEDAVADLVLNGNTLSPSATVIDREFFNKCDPCEGLQRYGEDYECWIRLAKGGARFYHVNQILGEYVRQESSLTMVNENYFKRTNELIVDFYDYLDKEKFSEQQINQLKEERRALNEYLLGRFYHSRKEYKKASGYYKKSKEMGNTSWKNTMAAIAAKLHVCI